LSKFYLVMGTIQAERPWLLVVFLVSTILNAAYFLPVVYRAFFPSPEAGGGRGEKFTWAGVEEAPRACVIPLCVTAGLAMVFFFVPGVWVELASSVVGGLK
jgi:multicomponent Na+:H+ antiporter subunit D